MKLTIQDIYKNFGNKEVLKGLNFNVESGKALGLLGRNGAGKTTTIRIISGVFKSDKGRVLIDDQPINYDDINIGYLPEERGLYPKKKIKEQLLYLAALKGVKKKDALAAIDYWMERSQMSEYLNKKLDTLSKGNQQKIQFISILISNPDIVILDEPFSGLDPVNSKLLEEIVEELIAREKIVIFSSHQMFYVEKFCDQIAILNNGEIVLSGSLKQIKQGYDRSKLVIKTNDLDTCKDFVSTCDMVESYEYGLDILVKLKDVSLKKDFIQALTNKVDVDGVVVYEPSLNDIFVEYTGGKKDETV